MAGSMHVEPHTPALGTVDPASVGTVQSVHDAAVQAEATRRGHYSQNVLGQGAAAGDPQPAEPTQQSHQTAGQNPQAATDAKSTV